MALDIKPSPPPGGLGVPRGVALLASCCQRNLWSRDDIRLPRTLPSLPPPPPTAPADSAHRMRVMFFRGTSFRSLMEEVLPAKQ